MSRFSVKIVLCHSPESICKGSLLCFTKFRIAKTFTPRRGRSRVSIENLLSQSSENFRRGNLLCLTKILFSISLVHKKGRREYNDFLSNVFCLTMRKSFEKEPFSASLLSSIEKC